MTGFFHNLRKKLFYSDIENARKHLLIAMAYYNRHFKENPDADSICVKVDTGEIEGYLINK